MGMGRACGALFGCSLWYGEASRPGSALGLTANHFRLLPRMVKSLPHIPPGAWCGEANAWFQCAGVTRCTSTALCMFLLDRRAGHKLRSSATVFGMAFMPALKLRGCVRFCSAHRCRCFNRRQRTWRVSKIHVNTLWKRQAPQELTTLYPYRFFNSYGGYQGSRFQLEACVYLMCTPCDGPPVYRPASPTPAPTAVLRLTLHSLSTPAASLAAVRLFLESLSFRACTCGAVPPLPATYGCCRGDLTRSQERA